MNVSALIDRRFSTFQIEVLILCFFMSLIDGFDSQIMSVAVPAVVEDMNLPPSALGALLSASQWGALVGALTLGNYADRVGRRLVLIFCGLLLSATMIGTAMAGSHLELVVLRILTGLGVGGAMPCFIALSIEYSPRRYRSTVASIVCSGVPVGGIVVGMMGAAMMPELGWRSVFWAGGALSLAVTLLTAWRIPESVAFAIAQRYPAAAIRRILERLAPGEIDAGETRFFTDDSAAGQVKASVRELFRGNLAWVTMLCWIAFFLSYIVLIGTLVWTPGLMRQSGMDMSSASLVLSLNNVGGLVGFIVGGYLADRFRGRFWLTLMLIYGGGTCSVFFMGVLAPAFWPVAVSAILVGFFIAAGVGVLYAFTALLYPVSVRSTGVGWASGAARIGASMGPLILGWLYAGGWGVTEMLSVLAALALANIVIIRMMGVASTIRRNAASEHTTGATPPAA